MHLTEEELFEYIDSLDEDEFDALIDTLNEEQLDEFIKQMFSAFGRRARTVGSAIKHNTSSIGKALTKKRYLGKGSALKGGMAVTKAPINNAAKEVAGIRKKLSSVVTSKPKIAAPSSVNKLRQVRASAGKTTFGQQQAIRKNAGIKSVTTKTTSKAPGTSLGTRAKAFSLKHDIGGKLSRNKGKIIGGAAVAGGVALGAAALSKMRQAKQRQQQQ